MKKIISFQITDTLLTKLDEAVKEQGGGNRSETLRLMIVKILENKALTAETLLKKEVVS